MDKVNESYPSLCYCRNYSARILLDSSVSCTRLPPALPLLGNFLKIFGIWESTWDLVNFPSNLGNSAISRKFREIVIPNL